MAPISNSRRVNSHTAHKLPHVDMLAVGIALALAALIRFGVIHHISF